MTRQPRGQVLLLTTALLVLGVGAQGATAQTVVATNAPRGSTVEVILHGTTAGSAVVGPDGVATIPIDAVTAAEPEMDVFVFVDVCDDHRRVGIVRTGMPSPPRDPGCTRREITGVFVLRAVSTVVVDLGGLVPRLFLIQGAFDPLAPPRPRALAPRGLVLSAGAGLTSVRDAADLACGNVQNCQRDGSGLGYALGAAYWFRPFLGAEGTYVKPAEVTAEGGGDTYRFNSALDAELATIAGVAGVPAGPIRIYGKAGVNYHRALFSTTQTIDDRPVTVADQVVGIAPGGTQTFQFRTSGWGWLFGGGLEAWVRRPFALYGEFGLAGLRGPDEAGSEAEMRDRLTYFVFGIKIGIGR
jgi:hypothetical protein